MKKILMLLLSVSISFMYGQESTQRIIQADPFIGQGYLVLNKQYPNIDYWEVKVINRIKDESGNNSDTEIDHYELIGKNYLKMSDEYIGIRGNLVVVIAHLTSSEFVEIELEIGPPPLPFGFIPPTLTNTWKCNGLTYAFKIDQYHDDQNGAYFYQFGTTSESYDPVIPYYAYFNATAFENMVSSYQQTNIIPQVNGVSMFAWYDIPNFTVDGLNVRRFQSGNTTTYYSTSNSPISPGLIYGVRKGLGPWHIGYNKTLDCFTTPDLFGSGASNLNDAISKVNINGRPQDCGQPLIYCSPSNNGGSSPIAKDKIPEDWEVKMEESIDFSALMDTINAHLTEDRGAGGVLTWKDNYQAISLYGLSDQTGEIAYIEIDELYDENGNGLTPSINLYNGLYTVGVYFSDGSYLPFVSEIDSYEDDNSNYLSSKLATTFYPVPIIGNEYNIALSANADLDFTYKLFDFNMNEIYNTEIHIAEGETQTIKVEIDNIPNGILVNQFTFSDGSQSSRLTTK